jgi:hypothetical protein
MREPAEQPCKQCPFRKSGGLAGYLGPYPSSEALVEDLYDRDGDFPCHTTRANGGAGPITRNTRRCAGGLTYMNNDCKLSRNRAIALEQSQLNDNPAVARNLDELVKTHGR